LPVHKIEMSQPDKQVLHSDITFDIYSDGEKLGSLKISKGSVDWTPRHKQRPRQIKWERFAAVLDDLYDQK
jgi:hypothetical protein